MKRFFVLLALLVSLFRAQAEGPDDQYVRIYNLIQQADTLQANGKSSQALSRYLEAQSTLQRFQKSYPDWNAKVVTFRLNYLSSRVGSLSGASTGSTPEPSAPAPGASPAPAPTLASPKTATPADWENQLGQLRDQTRQLQAEKQVLEAKLREALAAQPASVDPREFVAAQEKVKALQKENDSLKATMSDQQTQPAMGPDSKSLQRTQQLLAEANRKLNEQTEKANTLALEKQVLQAKLDGVVAGQTNMTAQDPNAKAVAEANSKVARLAAENESLQSRVKTLNADVEAAAALRAENQLLKKQLAEYKIAPTNLAKSDEHARKLAEAQTQIAALQSDKELLRIEKLALENRVKQMAQSEPAPVPAEPNSSAATKQELKDAKQANARIKKLEEEKAALQKKLDVALKSANSSKSSKKKGADAKVAEMETQLASLRARVDVFEAKPVPYSAEELALFRSSGTSLARADRPSNQTSVKELPAGSASLVAEAQRYFSNHEFDKAEEKYLEVLRHDQKNVYTLANLAAIELEQNHLDDAEKHVKQALGEAPDDGYSLSILGYLKFRQEKYDDAFDALSRAAQINPQSAEIQNFLGLTLSHKGMRIPAETALRKAIQLEPSYASAHNNLAVIYLTQQPPQVELARWHYQKALTFGHPHNADLEKMLDQKRTASNP